MPDVGSLVVYSCFPAERAALRLFSRPIPSPSRPSQQAIVSASSLIGVALAERRKDHGYCVLVRDAHGHGRSLRDCWVKAWGLLRCASGDVILTNWPESIPPDSNGAERSLCRRGFGLLLARQGLQTSPCSRRTCRGLGGSVKAGKKRSSYERETPSRFWEDLAARRTPLSSQGFSEFLRGTGCRRCDRLSATSKASAWFLPVRVPPERWLRARAKGG